MSIEVQTGARLHFGLLDVAPPFGGCGVMIDGPPTRVRVSAASAFASDVRHRDRIAGIVHRWQQMTGNDSPPAVAIEVLHAAPSHHGLGSGTQLSLAIADALLKQTSGETPAREQVLQLANRGRRSAVGSHGFFDPGLIVEGLDRQRSTGSQLNPIDQRIQLPDAWRVGVVLMDEVSSAETISGDEEQQQFDALHPAHDDDRSRLVGILTEQLIPAIERVDFPSFAKAVTQYNRSSGELFAPVQGGPYNGEATTQLIEQLIAIGLHGVGQSSWGPGVFTWFESEQAAQQTARNWRERFPGTRLLVQRPLGQATPH
ncbi:GHMP family kinase ATP-binding protein [Rhodopirellula sp. P2]|uniref:GHMP family kinase ATP-binding protein n=1 Tax=Rhodopirellula sp. P2 TaxID=2127060 RepID=UPI002367D780|nr:beta-ribofuranosylaminobenzene 5'-phosphate synthase [Rhodopirellula sp. P2]WDQ15298.1 beta-ribofuranosylaminobenzene 5'-phosphate synthase [Rhodopirellula sp. P2]